MTYALAMIHPRRIRRAAALSGFIPEADEAVHPLEQLSGKPVFVAHGRKDDLIPVERSRKAVELLKRGGAQVTYCESDAGHKVSKECLKEMGMFFKD